MSKVFTLSQDIVIPKGTVLTESEDSLTGSANVGTGGTASVTLPVNADNLAPETGLVTESEAGAQESSDTSSQDQQQQS